MYYRKSYLITEFSEQGASWYEVPFTSGGHHMGGGRLDLCTHRSRFFCDGVIRDLSHNLTLLGRNDYV